MKYKVDATNEIWRPIAGYEDSYMVSNLGRVKSLDRIRNYGNKYNTKYNQLKKGKILKQTLSDRGYLSVNLFKNSKGRKRCVHKIVAKAFLPTNDETLQVNHKNGIKTDNRVENLEWVTCSENIIHCNYVLRKGRARYIYQYDMKNNLLKRWNSIAEIVRELGFNSGNISRCCSHDLKQAYGYKWEYELIEPDHFADVGKMAEHLREYTKMIEPTDNTTEKIKELDPDNYNLDNLSLIVTDTFKKLNEVIRKINEEG